MYAVIVADYAQSADLQLNKFFYFFIFIFYLFSFFFGENFKIGPL